MATKQIDVYKRAKAAYDAAVAKQNAAREQYEAAVKATEGAAADFRAVVDAYIQAK